MWLISGVPKNADGLRFSMNRSPGKRRDLVHDVVAAVPHDVDVVLGAVGS